jgi:hypothetical protein
MLDLAQRLRLKLETPERFARHDPGVHHHNGDVALWIVLVGKADRTWAAGHDGFLDAVTTNGFRQRQGWRVGLFTINDSGVIGRRPIA